MDLKRGGPMHVVVDVGNTESVVGLFEPGALQPSRSWRYATAPRRTADELVLLLRAFLADAGTPSLVRGVVGSVVPAHTDLLRVALGRLVDGTVHVVGGAEGGTRLPIRLDVEEPRTVGADRIVNTLAAAHLYARDTIVVDLGTATTYDCITADAVFVGGVIAPGIQAGQEWLESRTAMLPRVAFQPPERVIGRRTESCLQSGIFHSAVDAMDGIVRRIRAEWGRPEALVVGTGGLAGLLAPHSSTMDRVEPWLTLVGLELAGGHLEAMAAERGSPSASGLDSKADQPLPA
ncbi:MAG: type III pantothenate kinase [Gemmatimonadales bacterium]|nr:MAG: type III pantothenate kinase [Gemmatimonadales bacterium]